MRHVQLDQGGGLHDAREESAPLVVVGVLRLHIEAQHLEDLVDLGRLEGEQPLLVRARVRLRVRVRIRARG